MAGVLQRNKLFDNLYWTGAADMSDLGVEVFGDDTCYIPNEIEFESTLGDWWPWFTADEDI